MRPRDKEIINDEQLISVCSKQLQKRGFAYHLR